MSRDGIVRAAWWGTAVFTLTAAIAALTRASALEVLAVAVDLVLFAAGCVIFLMAYARAVQRSRHERVDVAGVYLMMGDSAPPDVRRSLLGAMGVQIAVALVTAALDYPLAFGILVPTYGLALAGLWAARHGTFPAKAQAGA